MKCQFITALLVLHRDEGFNQIDSTRLHKKQKLVTAKNNFFTIIIFENC